MALWMMPKLAVIISFGWLWTGIVTAFDTINVLPDTCDSVHPRLEIRDLAKDQIQMTVFLLALQRMQATNSSDPASYYKIAGIHNFPFEAYNEVPRCSSCPSDGLRGYCPHSSTLFTIWHRPYMALFERSLRTSALQVASEYQEPARRRRYEAAAQTLRLPFWDFAREPAVGEEYLPRLFTENVVTVSAPSGRIQITNPLYQFNFNGSRAPNYQWLNQDHTTRYPDKNDLTKSRQDLAIAAVRQLHEKKDLRCGLYRVLYENVTFNHFASNQWVGGAINQPYDNIESLHDDIHNALGNSDTSIAGLGTMYYLDTSAFDPIFWMHHAAVDRYMALWQVLHPERWIESATGTMTWTIPHDMVVNGSTALSPFVMDTNKTPWTADASRNIASFCYSYPEVNNNSTIPQVVSAINSLYGRNCLVNPAASEPLPASSAPKPTSNSTIAALFAPRDVARTNAISLTAVSSKVQNLVTEEGAMRDYITNIRFDAMAVGDSPTVYIFDGPPSGDDPSTWRDSDTLLGQRTFLVKVKTAGEGNGMHGSIKGTVPLNNVLMERVRSGRLSGLSNDEVREYLTEHMEWRVVKADGTVVKNEDVPGLVVTVVTADVQPALYESQLPVWGNARLLSEITVGKAGGYK